MSSDGTVLTDTRDMFAIHDAFRRSLGDAPGQLSDVTDGDVERAGSSPITSLRCCGSCMLTTKARTCSYIPFFWSERPNITELFSRMDAQHVAVGASVEATERAAERFGTTGSVADGRALAAACDALGEKPRSTSPRKRWKYCQLRGAV